MAKAKPHNHGKKWTKSEEKKLEKLADDGKTGEQIARVLGRTEDAVYKHASREKISLN